ncbi:50S ribosomal protein L13 [Patescibacteria group bacterium]|nr:50S ribosomal protein L13 [Patescibacteria group bacterium]MCL5797271.1 50S ribosomal protein L13 [Patescibacteria group bacterium]
MKYTKATKAKDVRRAWHLVDVGGKILGRESTKIAQLLIGKGKPYFVPSLDCGDYVVIINAAKVALTGKKKETKVYMRFSGYPGGLKVKTFADVLIENPTRIIRESVAGMLPQNKLKDKMLKRLYIYADANHPYAQKFKNDN